jgi:hypothetical protein
MRPATLASVGFERFGKTTRRAAFLAEMDQVVPWKDLCQLIEPVYPKPGAGRAPVGAERMLRIYFLQPWFNPPDLLHGEEIRIWGNQAYKDQTAVIREHAPNARDFTNLRCRNRGVVDDAENARNRTKSKVRPRSSTASA